MDRNEKKESLLSSHSFLVDSSEVKTPAITTNFITQLTNAWNSLQRLSDDLEDLAARKTGWGASLYDFVVEDKPAQSSLKASIDVEKTRLEKLFKDNSEFQKIKTEFLNSPGVSNVDELALINKMLSEMDVAAASIKQTLNNETLAEKLKATNVTIGDLKKIANDSKNFAASTHTELDNAQYQLR